MDNFPRKFTKHTRKKVDEDGYITEEDWYTEHDKNGIPIRSERGAHIGESICDGKPYLCRSRLQEDYNEQEESIENFFKKLKRLD